MLEKHYAAVGATVGYGAVDRLFPVEELDATVVQYRDAQLALDDVDGSAVVAVAPTNLASGYRLAQHPLTAIRVDTLPAAVRTRLAEELDAPLDAFEFVQVGKRNSESANRSLAEFADA